MLTRQLAIISISAFLLISICNNQLLLAQIAAPSVKSIPLPVGSGARALGQGGAFIAVADDATAASWNPAGLIQLERPEASIVGSYMLTDQDFSIGADASGLGNMLGDEDVGRWDVNFLSVAYPFKFLRKNFVAALNYHQILDFHADISLNVTDIDLDPLSPLILNRQFDFKSSGGVGALSPGIAMLLFPKLTFGLTVNIFDDEFFGSHGWTESITGSGKGTFAGSPLFTSFRQKTSSRDYHGANVSLGILWDVLEKEDKLLTFGAVFHSPYTARFDQQTAFTSESTFSTFSGNQKSRIKMDWPMSIGLGLAFRYTDALSFSFDVQWTDWSEWVQKSKVTPDVFIDDNGNEIKIPPVNERPIGGGSEHDEIDDTYAVRFGAEYLMFRKKEVIAFRGGLFYEPRPSLGSARKFDKDGNPIDFSGAPTDVWGFSLGTGITTKRFSLDAAYQFRYVRDMEGRDIGLSGTEIDTVENMFVTSLIVYF
ncbi:MAG: OmpP1/FadL family transporter [Candidatus Anammoxibacter sp.]